jgi:hypothetical protein
MCAQCFVVEVELPLVGEVLLCELVALHRSSVVCRGCEAVAAR